MRSTRLFVTILVLLMATAAFAQMQPAPSPPQLTWVRFFNVDPAKSDDWVKYTKRTVGGVFDRLLNDGKLVSWGIATPFILTGQDWTHAVWITMQDWAAADQVVAAFEASQAKMSPAEREKDMQMMRAEKSMPRDVVLRHLVQSMTPPVSTETPKYIRISYYTVKPGRSDDAVNLFKEMAEQRYIDLAKGGAVWSWGFSTQDLIADPSWTHMVWYFTNDLSRFDQVRASSMAMGPEAREALMARLNDLSEPAKQHSEVLRIVHIAMAKPKM